MIVTAFNSPIIRRIDHLDRDIVYRPGTADEQVITDVFEHYYHRPPVAMRTPTTVMDCGAHIGLTMLDYRYLWPDAAIFGVELDPGNITLAHLNTDDPVLCAAVGGTGSLGWYSTDADTWDYSLLGADADRCAARVSLTDLTHDLHWTTIDFLKLDIEGSERALLRNPAEMEPVTAVVAELHGDYSKDDAVQDLRGCGFTGFSHMGHPTAVFAWRER